MNKTQIIMLLLILLAMPEVFALGITPGGRTVMFEPNQELSVSVSVLNQEHNSFSAAIYAEGALADYISFDTDRLEFTKDDTEKSFTYTVKLPKELEPGEHVTKIKVRELPDDTKQDTVTTLIGVVHQFRVRQTYPGKYPVVDLNIVQGDNNSVIFILPVFNLGDMDIDEAYAEIEIINPENISVADTVSNTITLKSKHRGELIAKIKLPQPGRYKAIIRLWFDNWLDNRIDEIEAEFSVGEFYLKLLGINVGKFELGEVARFNILVENIANVDVPDAHSQILLKDTTSRTVADMKSAENQIPANSKGELLAYWDTEGVQEGVYTGKATLAYDEKSSDTPITATVGEDKVKVNLQPITAHAIEEIPELEDPLKTLKVMFGLILILNMGLILYILFYRQKTKEDKNNDSKN